MRKLIKEADPDVVEIEGKEDPAAQAHFGASVFWLRRLAALGGEDAAVAHWQIKRNGERRGIIEIVEEEQ